MKQASLSQLRDRRPRRRDPVHVTGRQLHILLRARFAQREGPDATLLHLQHVAERLLTLWSKPFQMMLRGQPQTYYNKLEPLREFCRELFADVKKATSLREPGRVLQKAANLLVCPSCYPFSTVPWLTRRDLQRTDYSFLTIALKLVT